jgi:hypothetical protein
MASKILISHRRRTKREGMIALVSGILVPVLWVTLTSLFQALFWQDSPVFFWIFKSLGIVLGVVTVFGYAIPNMLMDREFSFVVSEDRIECKSPAKAYGESFSVPIDEIVAIEHQRSEDMGDWFLITRGRQRIRIPMNYGNPVRKIVAALRELRPELPLNRISLQSQSMIYKDGAIAT